jgi:hypothetical protein
LHGNLNAHECFVIAAFHRDQATQNEASAKRYDRVGSAVLRAGVDTVGELPDEVLEELLS